MLTCHLPCYCVCVNCASSSLSSDPVYIYIYIDIVVVVAVVAQFLQNRDPMDGPPATPLQLVHGVVGAWQQHDFELGHIAGA